MHITYLTAKHTVKNNILKLACVFQFSVNLSVPGHVPFAIDMMVATQYNILNSVAASLVSWLYVKLACGDQRRLTGNGSALEVVLHDYALYKSTFTLLTLLYTKSTMLLLCQQQLCASYCQKTDPV